MRCETHRIKTFTLAEAAHSRAALLALWLSRATPFCFLPDSRQRSGAGFECAGRPGRFWLRAGVHAVRRGDPAAALCARAHRGAAGTEARDALLVLIAFAAACAFFHTAGPPLEHIGGCCSRALPGSGFISRAARGLGRCGCCAGFSGGDTWSFKAIPRAAYLAAAYFVFAVFFVEFAGLFSAVDALKAGNSAFTTDTVLPVATDITGSKSLVFSYVVLALRFAAESLPTLLAAATAYFAIGLLDTMEDGAFTQESAAYAPKLAEWVSRCSSSACCSPSRSTFCRRSVRRCS